MYIPCTLTSSKIATVKKRIRHAKKLESLLIRLEALSEDYEKAQALLKEMREERKTEDREKERDSEAKFARRKRKRELGRSVRKREEYGRGDGETRLQGRAPPHGAPIAFHASFAVCGPRFDSGRPTECPRIELGILSIVVILRDPDE